MCYRHYGLCEARIARSGPNLHPSEIVALGIEEHNKSATAMCSFGTNPGSLRSAVACTQSSALPLPDQCRILSRGGMYIKSLHPPLLDPKRAAEEWRSWVEQWKWDRFVTLTFNQ